MLTTARLDLRKPVASDLPGLVALVAPEAVRRHLGGRQTDAAEEFARLLRNAGSWALYGYGTFIVRRRGEDRVIGICGVFHSWRGFAEGLDDVAEMGWIFAEDCWGQGYASEGAGAALDWFDRSHGPRRIACMIDVDNPASIRVAQRLGFTAYGRHGRDGEELVLFERAPLRP